MWIQAVTPTRLYNLLIDMEHVTTLLFIGGMITDLAILIFMWRMWRRMPDITAKSAVVDHRARRLRRDRERMVTILAHELRTPTAILIGYMDLILTGHLGEVGKEQQAAIEAMKRAAIRLQAMEESAIETIRPTSYEVFDLVELLQELIYEDDVIFSGTRKRREDVEITFTSPSRALVEADRSKIRAAAFELINNAIKWCESEVEVILRTNGDASIIINDNGPGVPAGEEKRIFELFYQVGDDEMTRRYEGSGFGLYVVSLMARLHDGAVHFDCDGGCSFQLIIPKSQL